jgi:hypothetical protein
VTSYTEQKEDSLDKVDCAVPWEVDGAEAMVAVPIAMRME